MAGEDVVVPDSAGRREQPFLYSWNRRVRHLHGVSLRNLNISPPSQRSRGKTITDDEYNLTTSAKQLALDERNVIHPSRSSSDLLKDTRSPSKLEFKKTSTQNAKHSATDLRPRPGKLRRRSTLHWTGASPRVRQQKLEDVAVDRLVDTWFSLHHGDCEEPIYISEVMYRSMNPSFSYFDLDAVAPTVARSDSCQLKVWAKNEHMSAYRLLIELSVNLRSLQFIGKSLESFHHPLPENCVVFHLSDGIYTSFADLPAEDIHEPQLREAQKSIAPASSSTYDALMKLANLDDCIQDALQTRQKLEAEINELLAQNKQEISHAHIETQREKVKATKAAMHAERKDVQRLSRLKADLGKSRDDRKKAMGEAIQAKLNASAIPTMYTKAVDNLRSELESLEELSRGQIRRVCENMHSIFPIEPVKNRALQFTIRGIRLPNSVFDDTNRDEIAAALGFTAQFVHQLSMYLSIPLPYEIEANASSSSITDTISMSLTQRKFPLYPTNVTYKFEYGVFLLNKDIEFLMNRVGLRVLDIRHTLPNLKYLVYMLTSGTGDLPARKVGGVKGLLTGVVSPSISRRSSDDSVYSSRHSGQHEEHANGGQERERSPDAHDALMGAGRMKGMPYRRSLLREAG